MSPHTMQLAILTPTRQHVIDGVGKVIAEGNDGFFALLPRHADLVAVLVPGLLSYTGGTGREHFLGVDHGVLVKCGHEVRVSVLGAFESDDLGALRERVARQFLSLDEHERGARTALARLEGGAIRGVLEIER